MPDNLGCLKCILMQKIRDRGMGLNRMIPWERICSISISHLVTECTRACQIYLQKHKKIPESESSNFLLGVFCYYFVGFDYIEYSVHGLRCISGSSVCRAVFCGHSEPC